MTQPWAEITGQQTDRQTFNITGTNAVNDHWSRDQLSDLRGRCLTTVTEV